MIDRRSVLTGIIAAPVVVRSGLLMRIKPVIVPSLKMMSKYLMDWQDIELFQMGIFDRPPLLRLSAQEHQAVCNHFFKDVPMQIETIAEREARRDLLRSVFAPQ